MVEIEKLQVRRGKMPVEIKFEMIGGFNWSLI